MHLELLAGQSAAVKIHVATVVPSFFLGTWLLVASKKGSRAHRAAGFVYLTLMTVTATAAIFVQSLRPGHFTWIHLFIPLTYFGVFGAIRTIREGDIKGHQRAMWGLYIGALVIAGALTFYPGRLMWQMFVQ